MALFHDAVERTADERAALLGERAGGDLELRAEVELLLAADADAASLLLAPASDQVAVRSPGAAPEASEELLGRLQRALGPSYRVERELGGGGMSRVFLAHEERLGRRVVVKVLPHDLGRGLDAERFRREVRLAATLRHPHVVPLLMAGESVDGLFYYTMPYIEGESLRHRLDRDGPLPAADVARVVREVADALAYAHRRGVVHRDIKPANVLVDGEHVLVADFGIATALAAAGAPARDAAPAPHPAASAPPVLADGGALTARGAVIGTPAYMSPEQGRGEAVDGRSDVYSLGWMTYELLTGHGPAASRRSAPGRDALLPPPSVVERRPGVPGAVDAVIARALAPRPSDRFQTTDALARALAEALDEAPSGGRAPSHPPAAQPRRRAGLLGGAALAALAALAVAVSTDRRQPAVEAARVPAAGNPTAGIPPTVPPAAASPTLAVLPFRNLGRPDDQYFADGIADEVTTRLARVSGLGVIAWTSASRYKGVARPGAEIGRELDAGYVLEGSVQWARTPGGGNRVRVTPRLVRVSDARQIWAEPYEAELANVFAIQTAVAERVAAALDVALLAPERRSVAARPTRGVAAYDSYLRGNALTTRGLTYVPQARRDAARHYERAVALDPAFASAWARLALAHWRIHVSRDDPTPARLARARAAAARAFALDSTLPEANLALGEISDGRWGAIERYVVALRAHPNNTELLYALGAEQLALGRHDDALASYTRAVALDPRSPDGPAEIANLHDVRGEYGRAVRVRARQIALDSSSTMAYVAQAVSLVNWRGDTAAVRRTLDQAVRAAGRARLLQMLARGSGVRVARVLWPALDGATRRALDTLSVAGAQAAAWRVYRLKADHFELSGRAALAAAYHDSARASAAAALRERPADAELHETLGLAYAGLGRAADALREGRRAVALDSAAAERDHGRWRRYALAMIAARVGARDVALAQLAGGLPVFSPSVSAHWFQADPVWAPLRGDPRLVRLLAEAP
jgi:serine/threonine-protein kinase